MPHAVTEDGVKLYYEEAGQGFPVLFVHEFAGDYRSWEPQMRYFSRHYRCIAYNARGFPPSDVPADVSSYSQQRACDDVASVLRHLDIERAHVVGLSMGGFATLHFGLNYPEMARSLVVGGCGYGSETDKRQQFHDEAVATAELLENKGSAVFAEIYAVGPTRVQFQNKDPRGWQEFKEMLAEHLAQGSALTMRGLQALRPSVWELEEEMKKLTVPTLIISGDEDEPCLLPNVYMKRTIPSAGLQLIPKSGHTINIEEPELFNEALEKFFTSVENGGWSQRDARSVSESILTSR
jgi:pimeloyl-ACP methyl ester carboxylesterase